MRTLSRSSVHTSALAALLAGVGCATGPAFTTVEPPGRGAAAVYVYREAGVLGAGVTHKLLVNASLRGLMVNGGYKRIEVAAGPAIVSAIGCEKPAPVMRLTSGQVGYVQLELINKTIEMGGRYYFDYGCRLVQRSESEALAVLSKLRLTTD